MPTRHYIGFDGWRGIAALLIAMYHFRATSSFYGTLLVQNAWLFVDFFFVLGGVVIAAKLRTNLFLSGTDIHWVAGDTRTRPVTYWHGLT